MSDETQSKGALTEEGLRGALNDFSAYVISGFTLLGHELLLADDDMCATTKTAGTDKVHYTQYHGRYYFLKEYENELHKECYIPHADSPGVYLIFDADKKSAAYVGKAEVTIGDRVWTRYQHYKTVYAEISPNYYVISIPLREEVSFLAPALESYLLKRYAFPENTQQN